MQNAISRLAHKKLLYAHRGANLHFPENTLEAFSHAVLLGANALELDVHRTKDDVIVVFHDKNGKRLASEKSAIKDCSFDQIQEWKLIGTGTKIPTLKSIIEHFSKTPLNVDIKAHDTKTVVEVVGLVKALNAESRVRLTSESFKVIKRIRSLGYVGPSGLSAVQIAMIYFLPRFVLQFLDWRKTAAQVPQKFFFFSLCSKRFITKCHDLGIRVDFWVINDVQTANALWELGADGIMTDDPSVIRLPSSFEESQ